MDSYEQQFCSPPALISEERWWEMLGVLPPEDWQKRVGNESFKVEEYTSGCVTSIFCRIGAQYFELCDNARLPHDEIVNRCEALAVCRKLHDSP